MTLKRQSCSLNIPFNDVPSRYADEFQEIRQAIAAISTVSLLQTALCSAVSVYQERLQENA